MSDKATITTTLCKNNKDFIAKRKQLIEEAVLFPCGTDLENQYRNVINKLSNGTEICFYRPGKEAIPPRKRLNKFDMYPAVEANSTNLTPKWAFEQLWEYLIKISVIHQDTFKKVMVLLYRLCFLFDHKEQNGKLRYAPSDEILAYIGNIQKFVLDGGFNDKFDSNEISLLEFLYFTDLLAWNEDVKYHTTADGKADFESINPDTGRKNTVLTVISAPVLIGAFIQDIIYKTSNRGVINVKLITSTIQKFAARRGICTLTNKELLDYLSPYLTEK